MGPNKFIHMLFAVGSLLIAFILTKMGDWIWGYFAKPNDLAINGIALMVGVTVGILAYKSEKVFGAAADVVHELEKVTWPTRRETYAATIVVLVTVGISALILTGFDSLWAFLANRILRG